MLELGLAIPIVFVLLLGTIDFARGFSIKLQLEQVAQRSIERVMNGQADRTQLAAIKAEAAAAAGVDPSAVTTNAWLECSAASGAPPLVGSGGNCNGGSGARCRAISTDTCVPISRLAEAVHSLGVTT